MSCSLTAFDKQSCVEEASLPVSLTGSVYTDESPRLSWVFDFSDFSGFVLGVDPDPSSIFGFDLASLPVGAADDGFGPLLVVPVALEPIFSTQLVFELASTTVTRSAMPTGSPCLSTST
jgi:hypothetical protein